MKVLLKSSNVGNSQLDWPSTSDFPGLFGIAVLYCPDLTPRVTVVSFSAHSPSNSRLSSSRRRAFVSERKAATRKNFRRSFFEQLEARQVMATLDVTGDSTIPGGAVVGDSGSPMGEFFQQHLDTYDGVSKVVASDPRVVAWDTANFANDSFLVRFVDSVDRTQAEATLAAEAPGSAILTWDETLHNAWVSLPVGSTREDVLDVSHHFLDLSNTLYAEPSFVRTLRRTPNDPVYPLQWNMNNTGQAIPDSNTWPFTNSYSGFADADVDAPEAWDLTTGSPNQVIAILDSGYNRFEQHMQANYWVNPGEVYDGKDNDGNGVIDDYNGYDSANRDGDPQDDAQTEHGMEVASIAAAPGDDGFGMTGINWHAKLMFIRIEDASGGITTGGVIGGLQYVAKMKQNYGINVVAANMSFGGPNFSFSESDALKLLGSKDVLICTAVDNQGFNHDVQPDFPTAYNVDQILTVTATNAYDDPNVLPYLPGALPDFGYGAVNVDIAAPGVDVMLTTFRYVIPGTQFGTNLKVNTGTSFATPMVSGTAALMESLAPYLSATEIKSLIISSADKISFLNNLNVADGRLNVFSALSAIPKTTISGTIFQDANNDKAFGIGESGLGGWTVYLDLDNDGVFDANEPSTVSVTNTGTTGPVTGSYTFDAYVDKGTYKVRQVLQTGFTQTTPLLTSNGGANVITVGTRGQDFTNVNFGDRQQPGSITGTKFLDTNGNGTREAGEPGLKGVLFYVDLNGNRQINVGEPAAYTDANGNFTIPNMQPGTYDVREVLAGGYVPTLPATLFNGLPDPVLSVTVVSNAANSPGLLFGNKVARDYGDLPETAGGNPTGYHTTIANNGPSHGILPGFMLGVLQDAETNGLPSATAQGDDFNPTGANSDEDGLVSLNLVQGQPGAITLRVTNSGRASGYIQAWIDFNQNGSFADPGDQILKNFIPVDGVNSNIPFAVPANVAPGVTYARIRYSYDRNLGPDGPAQAGEVEDYQFTVFSSLPIARNDRFPEQLFPPPNDPAFTSDPLIKQESANNELNVLRNDPLPNTGTLSIVAGSFPAVTANGGTLTLGVNISGKQVLFYTPRGGINPFTGIDTFTYTVTNGTDTSLPATVQVFVTAKDPRPVDDTFVMVGNVPSNPNPQPVSLAMNVLANENDVNTPSAPISIGGFTQPVYPVGTVLTGPTVAQNGSNLVITPPTGFVGTVQFQYTVTDTDPSTVDAVATVTVEVTANPSPPAAAPDSQYVAIISLRVVDARGFVLGVDPGFRVDRGEVFRVEAYSEDIRPGGSAADRGVEAAFLDLLYDRNFVAVNFNGIDPDVDFVDHKGTADPSDDVTNYNADQNKIINSPEGVVNELGGAHLKISNPPEPPLGLGKKLIASVGFDANAAGTIIFRADPAEDSQDRTQILLAPAVGSQIPIAADDKVVFMIPSLPVTIKEPGAPEYINTRDALDVNADSRITAFDALAIINDLNTRGARSLREYNLATAGELPPAYFVDVNNDGQMTAFDAIQVITWLNIHGAGEATGGSGGEFVAAASAPSSASGGEFVESTGGNSNPVIGPLPSVTTSRAAAEKATQRVSGQHDDSNLLYLAAVDQLMASGNKDNDSQNSAQAEEESLSEWLSYGGRLRGQSTAKSR